MCWVGFENESMVPIKQGYFFVPMVNRSKQTGDGITFVMNKRHLVAYCERKLGIERSVGEAKLVYKNDERA